MKKEGNVIAMKPMAKFPYNATQSNSKQYHQHQSRQQYPQQQHNQQAKDASIKKRTISEEGISGEGMSLHWLSVLEDAAQAARSCQSLYDGRHDNSFAFSRSSSTKSSFARFFCVGKKKRKRNTSRERNRKKDRSRSRDRYGDSGNPTAAAILDRSIKSSTSRREGYPDASDTWPKQHIYSVLDDEEARKQRVLVVHKLNSLSQSGRGSLSGWGDSGVMDQSSDLGTSFGDDGLLTSSTVGSAKTKPDYHSYYRSMSTLTPQQQQQHLNRQQTMHEQIETKNDNKDKEMTRSRSEQTLPRTPNKSQEMKTDKLSHPQHVTGQYVVVADVEPVPLVRKNRKAKLDLENAAAEKMKKPEEISKRIESGFDYQEERRRPKRRNGQSNSPTTSEEARQGSATTSSKTSLNSSASAKTDSDKIFIGQTISGKGIRSRPTEKTSENKAPVDVNAGDKNLWINKNRISSVSTNRIMIENYQIEPKPRIPCSRQEENVKPNPQTVLTNRTSNVGLIVKSHHSREFYPNAKLADQEARTSNQIVPDSYQSDDSYMETISNSTNDGNNSGEIKIKKDKMKDIPFDEVPYIDSCPSPKKNEIDTILEESFATSGSVASDIKSGASSSDDTIENAKGKDKMKKKKKLRKVPVDLTKDSKTSGDYTHDAKKINVTNDAENEKVANELIAKNEMKIIKPLGPKALSQSSSSSSSSSDRNNNFNDEVENLKKLESENLGRLEYHGSDIMVEIPSDWLNSIDEQSQTRTDEGVVKWQTPGVYKCRQTCDSDVIFENVTYTKGKPPASIVKRCVLTLVWSFTKMEIKDESTSFVRVARLMLDYDLKEKMDNKNDKQVFKSVVHERKKGDGETQWLEENGDDFESSARNAIKPDVGDDNLKFTDTSVIMEVVRSVCESLGESIQLISTDIGDNKMMTNEITVQNDNDKNRLSTAERKDLKIATKDDNVEKEPFTRRKSSITYGKDDELFEPKDASRYSNVVREKPFSKDPEKVIVIESSSNTTKSGPTSVHAKTLGIQSPIDSSSSASHKPSSKHINITPKQSKELPKLEKANKTGKIRDLSDKSKSISQEKLTRELTSSDEKYETADDEMLDTSMKHQHPELSRKQTSELKCGGFGSRNIKDYIDSDDLKRKDIKYDLDIVESSITCIGANNYIIEKSEKHFSSLGADVENSTGKFDSLTKTIKSSTVSSDVGDDMSTFIIRSTPLNDGDDKMWTSDKEIDFNERPFATSSPKHEDFFDEDNNLKPGIADLSATRDKIKNIQDDRFSNQKFSRNTDPIVSDTEDEKFMSPLNRSFVGDDPRKKDKFDISTTSADQEWFSCDQYESDKQDTGMEKRNVYNQSTEKGASHKDLEDKNATNQTNGSINTQEIDGRLSICLNATGTLKRRKSLGIKENELFSDTDTETLVKESSTSTAETDEDAGSKNFAFDGKQTVDDTKPDNWNNFDCGHEKFISMFVSEALAQLEKEFSDKIQNIPSIDWSTVQVPQLDSIDTKVQRESDQKLISILGGNQTSDFIKVSSIPPPTYEEFMEEERKLLNQKEDQENKLYTNVYVPLNQDFNLPTYPDQEHTDLPDHQDTRKPNQPTDGDSYRSFACGCHHYVELKNVPSSSKIGSDSVENDKKKNDENQSIHDNDTCDAKTSVLEWYAEFKCGHSRKTATDHELICDYMSNHEDEFNIYRPDMDNLDNSIGMEGKIESEKNEVDKIDTNLDNRGDQGKKELLQPNNSETVKNVFDWYADFTCGHSESTEKTDKNLIADYSKNNKDELNFYRPKDTNIKNNDNDIKGPNFNENIDNQETESSLKPSTAEPAFLEWYANFTCEHVKKTLTDKELIDEYLKNNRKELDLYKQDTDINNDNFSTELRSVSDDSGVNISQASDTNVLPITKSVLEWYADFTCGHVKKTVTDEELISEYLKFNSDELEMYKSKNENTVDIELNEVDGSNNNWQNISRFPGKNNSDGDNQHILPIARNVFDWCTDFTCGHIKKSVTDKELISEYLKSNKNELDFYTNSEENVILPSSVNINDDKESILNKAENANKINDAKTSELEIQPAVKNVLEWYADFTCGHLKKTLTDCDLIAEYIKDNEDEVDFYRPNFDDNYNHENDFDTAETIFETDQTEFNPRNAHSALDWYTDFRCGQAKKAFAEKDLIADYLKDNQDELNFYDTKDKNSNVSQLSTEEFQRYKDNSMKEDAKKNVESPPAIEEQTQIEPFTQNVLDWYADFTCCQMKKMLTDQDVIAEYLKNNREELDFFQQKNDDITTAPASGDEPLYIDSSKNITSEKEIPKTLSVSKNVLEWYMDFTCGHIKKTVTDEDLIDEYMQSNKNELEFYKPKDENISNLSLKSVSQNKNNTKSILDVEAIATAENVLEWYANFTCGHIKKTLTNDEVIEEYLKSNESELDFYRPTNENSYSASGAKSHVVSNGSRNQDPDSLPIAKSVLDWYMDFTCGQIKKTVTDEDLIAEYLTNNRKELDFYKLPAKSTVESISSENKSLVESFDQETVGIAKNVLEWYTDFTCCQTKKELTDSDLIKEYIKNNKDELEFYRHDATFKKFSSSAVKRSLDETSTSTPANTFSKSLSKPDNPDLGDLSLAKNVLEWYTDFTCGHIVKNATDQDLISEYIKNHKDELDFYKKKGGTETSLNINDDDNVAKNKDEMNKTQLGGGDNIAVEAIETAADIAEWYAIKCGQEKYQEKNENEQLIEQLKKSDLESTAMYCPDINDSQNNENIIEKHDLSERFHISDQHDDEKGADGKSKNKKLCEESTNLGALRAAADILDWCVDVQCGHESKELVTEEQMISTYLEENNEELKYYLNTDDQIEATSNYEDLVDGKNENEKENSREQTYLGAMETAAVILDWCVDIQCGHESRESLTDKQMISTYLEKNDEELKYYSNAGDQIQTLGKYEDAVDGAIKNEKGTLNEPTTINLGAMEAAADILDWCVNMPCGHESNEIVADEQLISTYLESNDELKYYLNEGDQMKQEDQINNERKVNQPILIPTKPDEDVVDGTVKNEKGTLNEPTINLGAMEAAADILDWCVNMPCRHGSNEIVTDKQMILTYLENNDELKYYSDAADQMKQEDQITNERKVSQPIPIPTKPDIGILKESDKSSGSSSSSSNIDSSDDLEMDIDRYFAENGEAMKRVSPSNRSSVSLSEFQGIGNDVQEEEPFNKLHKKSGVEEKIGGSLIQPEEKENSEVKDDTTSEIKNANVTSDKSKSSINEKTKRRNENEKNKSEDSDGKSSSDSEDKRKTNTSPIFGGFKKLFFDFFKVDKQEEQKNNQEADKGKSADKKQDLPAKSEEESDFVPTEEFDQKKVDDQNRSKQPTSHNNDNQNSGQQSSSSTGDQTSSNTSRTGPSTSQSTFYEFHMNHKPRRPDDNEDNDDPIRSQDIRIVKTTHEHSNNIIVQVFARNDVILKEVEKQYPEYEVFKRSPSHSDFTDDVNQVGSAKQCPTQTAGRASRASPNNSDQSGSGGQNNRGSNEFLSPNQRGGTNRSRSPSGSPNRRNPSVDKRKYKKSMMRGPGEVFPSRDTMEENFDYIPNRVTVQITPSMDDQITATLNTVENFYRMIEDLEGDGLSWPKVSESGRFEETQEKRNAFYDKRRPGTSEVIGTSTAFAFSQGQMRNQFEPIFKGTTSDGTPVDRDDENQNDRQKFEGKWVPVTDYKDSDGNVVKLPGMTDAEWMTLTDGKGQYATAGGGRIFARKRRSRGGQRQGSGDSSETASLNGSTASGEENFFDAPCPETDQLLLSVRGMRFIYFLDKTEEATTAATKLVTDIIGGGEHDESIDGLDHDEDEDTLEGEESDAEDGTGGRLTDHIMLIFAASDLAAGAFGGIGGDPGPESWDDEAYRIKQTATVTTTTASTTVTETGFTTPGSSRSEVIIESNGDKYRAPERWTTVNSFHGGSGSVDDLDSNLEAGDVNYYREGATAEDSRKWFSDEEHPIHSPPSRDELRRRHRSIEDGITSFDERIHNLTDRIQRLKSVELDLGDGRTASDRRSIESSSTDRREYLTSPNFYTTSTTSQAQPKANTETSNFYSYSGSTSSPSKYTAFTSDAYTVSGRETTSLSDVTFGGQISTYRTSSDARYSSNQSTAKGYTAASVTSGNYKTAFEGSGSYGRTSDVYGDVRTDVAGSSITSGAGYVSAVSGGSGLYGTTIDGVTKYGSDFRSGSSYGTATTGMGYTSTSGSVQVSRGDEEEDTFDPVVTAHEYAEMISIFKYCSIQFRRTLQEVRGLRWTDGRSPAMVLPPRWVWGGPFAESRTRSTPNLHSSSIVHLSEQREYSPIAVAIVSDNFYVVATSNILYSQPGTIAVAVSRRRRSRRKRRTDARQENENGKIGDDSSFDYENGNEESSP